MKTVNIIIFLIFFSSCKEEEIEVKLTSFESSECKKNISYDQQGDMKKSLSDDTGVLKVSVYGVANCCSEFEPVFEIRNDTIDLGFREFGRICSCDCCYDFIYYIQGIKNPSDYYLNYTNPIVEVAETIIEPEFHDATTD